MRNSLFGFFIFILILNVSPSWAASKTILLAGGCFWCIEHDMRSVQGVLETRVGYAGGDRPSPTYKNYNDTDSQYKVSHIEVIKVTYDTHLISQRELLNEFLRKIDPTDGAGQFCDRGPSYRPAIFVDNQNEKKIALAVLTEAEQKLQTKVNVDILPQAKFWEAEEYHQNFAEKNSLSYKYYRYSCGRDKKINQIWGEVSDAQK